MNWLAFGIGAWVFMGLEIGLKDALRLGPQPVAPSFTFVYLTLIGMFAPARTTVWSAVILGVLMDLTSTVSMRQIDGVVLGPTAMGYLLGSQLILAMRGVMIRRNPLTLGFLALCGACLAQIVLVAIFTLRSAYDPMTWEPARELWTRLGSALYTGALGALLGLVLIPLTPALGLPNPQQRRFSRKT